MKNYKIILVIIFALYFLTNQACFAQVFSFETKQTSSTAVFPAGALLKGTILNQMSSVSSKIGDEVYFLIPFDVKIGKITCIPKKSLITGHVINVERAKPGRNGLVQIKFEHIKFPDGWGAPLVARIWTEQRDGIIGGEATKRNDLKKVVHYIEDIGAVAQLVETGERVMGQEKIIKAGTELVIVLDNNLEVKYLEKM